ncbi:MAG: TonB-dependent receptor [Bacteroidales bacterium]|nr:TonB-dependent receptor [Bacteroidales bacterium]
MKHSAILLSLIFTSLPTFSQNAADSTRTHHLGEIVVTGSNTATGRNLLPYTVSTISGKQLEATGNTQLLGAISGIVPSLFVSERNIFGFGVSNGGSGHIKLRGVGGDRASAVLMMVDGQPQFAGIYSHQIADFYQTEYVDKVEILRGPASVLYGSNAMAGVINVITKNALRNGSRTTLTSQYGSYNTWLTSLTNTTRYGNFSSLISSGYDRTDGLKKNFDFKQSNLYAKIGYDFSDNWSLKADYTLMQFIGNDPIYPTLSDPESTDIYHQNIIRGESSLTATNFYGNTSGAVRVYYSYGNHFIDDPRHFHSLDDRLGVTLYQNIKPWIDANATIGFDFDRYTGKIPVSGGNAHTEGSISTIDRKSITEYSPYVTLSQNLWSNRIILNAGVRMANSNKFDTQWIPQGGFVVHPIDGWTVKGSVAKGYRNPSFRELYLYRMANQALHPENMMNYELTLGKSVNRWLNIDMTAYYSKGSDMIQTVDMKNVNTGRFINKGVEVSARSNPLNCLQLWATYSYLHTSLKNLTGAPKNQYYLGIGWDAFRNFHADAELKGIGDLYVADDIQNQNYATVNLRLSYMIIKQLQLFVNLDNITDARYTINRGYEMPGFTVMGGFKLSI